MPAVLETLEGRRLLSTTLASGVLSVNTGNVSDDNVSLALIPFGPSIVVSENGTNRQFDIHDVSGIKISTGGGNDRITLSNDTLTINIGVTQFHFALPRATITGGSGNDTIQGGPGADEIYGDTKPLARRPQFIIAAPDGNDSINGGKGNDTIHGNGGNDQLDGSTGNDSIFGDDGIDTILCGAAPDGADFLSGGAPSLAQQNLTDDRLDYSRRSTGVSVNLNGQPVSGAPGEADTVLDDFEFVNGSTKADTLIGTDHGEALFGDGGDDQINGLGGNDALLGGDGNDTIVGGEGIDRINGGKGNNRLEGQGGDDTFDTFEGSDSVFGGDGLDTISYELRTANLTIALDGVAHSGAAGENDLLAPDIEHLIGGKGSDVIDGSDVNNQIEGRGGHDVINGRGGNDSMFSGAESCTLIGGDGKDTLSSGSGDDSLDGGGGDDALFGSSGNDTLSAGDGNDTVIPGLGDDVVRGGAGLDQIDYTDHSANLTLSPNDQANSGGPGEHDLIASDFEVIFGGTGNDIITGTDEANTLFGGGGNDLLRGNGGDDSLRGGDGSDTLDGGAGKDLLIPDDHVGGFPLGEANPGNADVIDYSTRTGNLTINLNGQPVSGAPGEGDTLNGDFEIILAGSGNDRIVGTNAAEKIFGRAGNDTIDARGGDDRIDGGDGNDTINGGAGNDTLRGENGNDRLDGGNGNDSLIGGEGNDVLIGRAGIDRLLGQSGNDTLIADDLVRDILDGGLGKDRFRADAIDNLLRLETRL
jgi:Ca2+-binding RTX toxin-like protein